MSHTAPGAGTGPTSSHYQAPMKRTMAEQVTSELRQRLTAGHWQPGQMLPGRRALAQEFGVAVGTLERAMAVLLADGLLHAADGRGTTVAPNPAAPPAPATPPDLPRPFAARGSLRGTVGIMAALVPYPSAEVFASQWPAQILAGCEHGLASEPGLVQRFVNLLAPNAPRLSHAAGAQFLLAEHLDALVVIGEQQVDEVVPLAEAAGVPLVCAALDPVAPAVPQVYLDGAYGGALAVRHLRARGFAPLLFLQPFAAPWAATRLTGAQAAAGAAALHFFPAQPGRLPSLAQAQAAMGAATGRELLAAGFAPGTGVIAVNDAVAAGFMAAASERGLQAGRDYGIVGFDDRHREQHLTSLRPPIAAIGEEAARLVLRLVRGEPCPTRVSLPHCLIARASTQPWRRVLHATASQPCSA